MIAGKIGIRDFQVMSLTRLFLTFCFKRDFSISRFGPHSPRSAMTCEMVQALVDQGDVDEANSSDLDCVGKAITAAARRGLDLT